jgi:hypothetical protein
MDSPDLEVIADGATDMEKPVAAAWRLLGDLPTVPVRTNCRRVSEIEYYESLKEILPHVDEVGGDP